MVTDLMRVAPRNLGFTIITNGDQVNYYKGIQARKVESERYYYNSDAFTNYFCQRGSSTGREVRGIGNS